LAVCRTVATSGPTSHNVDVKGRSLAILFGIVLASCQATSPSTSLAGAETSPSEAVPTVTPAASPETPATPQPTAAPTPVPTASPVSGIVYDEYAGGRNWIAMIQPDGSDHHRLANPGTDIEPTLSPNGQQIAFTRTSPAKKPGIYVMNANGSNPHLVASITGHPVQSPAWSPDGTKLAFLETSALGVDFAQWALYTVNVNGTGLKKVTGIAGGDRPAWSPDGTKIAFANSNGGGIWTISPLGKNLTQVTNGIDSFAAWSPDGKKIVFERQDESDPNNVVQHIFEASADGSNVSQVTSGTTDDEYATWSPDGKTILFSRFNSAFKADLYLRMTDGTLVDITRTATISELEPSWR